jgi:hypothetical protein
MSTDGSFNTGPAIPILGVGLGRLLEQDPWAGRTHRPNIGLSNKSEGWIQPQKPWDSTFKQQM